MTDQIHSNAISLDQPITIDVISDLICPWCYIGKRRLERALDDVGDLPVIVRWHPFQLEPSLPKSGQDRQLYLSDKFGSEAEASKVYRQIAEAGSEEGIPFAFERIEVTPNTLDAHRLVRWAAVEDCQDAVVEGLFQAYFIDGRHIGDDDTLIDIAETTGLDGEVVRQLLPTDSERQLIEKEIATAHEMGVTGVPAMLIDQKYAVMGAQQPDTILKAIERAVQDRLKQPE